MNQRYGYTLLKNKPYPSNENAVHKYFTGIFDENGIDNQKSYLEEIFEICNYEYNKEPYILPLFPKSGIIIERKLSVIGLNTGCGSRWTSRNWPTHYWLKLIELLKNDNYEVLLLGGEDEYNKNKELGEKTGALIFKPRPIKDFIGIMNECDVIVTVVSMAMHIAIGLKKKLILFNNIFNKNEFDLFDRGEIIEPERKCKCYFMATCKNEEYQCIEHISPHTIYRAIKRQLNPAV